MKSITTYCILFILLFSLKIQAQEPNIILIIADDMGWNQVSSTTTTFVNGAAHPSDFYETPTMDLLASEGISFPNGYVNGANCAPTRAALLSGQYAARPHNNIFTVYDLNRGNTAGNSNLIGPDMGLASNGNIDEIPASAITIAESIKTEGYATAHFGKYHMGEFESDNVSNNAATDQGFDYNYGGGTTGGPGNYFATESGGNWTFHGNVGPELDPYADPYTETESIALSIDHANYPLTGTPKHVTDAMTDAAIDFINTEINNPFFMHFSQFAIHGPFGTAHARPDLLAKYQAKKSSNPSSMNHDSDVGQVAIAEGMDQAIGRLIDYLKATPDPRNGNKPLSENTLVYFIADNGDAIKRSAAQQGQTPLKGMKGEYYEGGIRSITFAWTEPADPIGNPTYTPMLANMGTINHTPIIAFDLYPTFVEAAGGTLPGGGYDIDGISQWQMLTNGTAMTRETLFWHHPGYLIDSKRDSRPVTVIRKGDYKLMHFYEDASYELYNLVNDLNENNNLLPSGDQAIIDIANDMITDMTNHLTDTSAPLPTYRDGGATVPMPTSVSVSSLNSEDGCQAEAGYDAYWDFDSVSNTDDVSANLNNAITEYGTITYDNSDYKEGDQSIIFSGAEEIRYDDGSFLNDGTTARSVSVWIKPTALSGTQEIFEEGGSGNGFAFRLNGNSIEALITNNTDPDESVSASYPSDGNWHHVALIFDGANTTLSIYIDGVLAGTNTSAFSNLNAHSSPGGIGGVIGGGDAFGSGSEDSFFIGKMDAFAVYNSVLTLAQIQSAACFSVSNSTSGIQAAGGYEAYWDFDIASSTNDASGNNHHPDGIVGSGTLTYDDSDFKEGDQSIIFDGASAIQYATYLDADSFLKTALSTRSVMVWIKPSILSGIQNIFDEGGKNRGIAIRLNGSTLECIVRDTSSSADQTSAAFPNDGTWHHIALVYDGNNSTQRLYIDGVQVNNNSAPSTIIYHDSHAGVGGKLSGTDSFNNSADVYFSGKMDAFAVYDNAVTLSQVEESAGLNALGTENIDKDIGLVYPNPFKNKINIKLNGSYTNSIVHFYDMLGKLILSEEFSNKSSFEIPVNDLSKGIYLLKIVADNKVIIKKVLKE